MMRIVIVILIGLFSLYYSVAHADFYESLDFEKKQEILKKLNEHLPKMITVDDGLKEYAEYVTSNVPLFATNLGKLSAGEYTPIISQSLSLGGEQLADYFEDTLDDDSLGKIGFSYIKGKTGSFKKIGISLMDIDNSWGDVGAVVWEETKTVLKEDLQEASLDAVKKAFNWVFGNPNILGFSPAELYIMGVQAELQFIDVEIRRSTINKTNAFYEPYLQLREKGKTHFTAWEESNRGPHSVGADVFFALGDLSEEQLKGLFNQCYKDQTYSHNLYEFMKYELGKDVAREKADLAKSFEGPKNIFKKNVQQFWKDFRTALNQLIDEAIEKDEALKKSYEEVLRKAETLLQQIKDNDEKRQFACKNYKIYKEIREKALDTAYGVEVASEKLDALFAQLKKCPEMLRELREINQDYESLKKLYTKHKNFVETFQQEVNQVCSVAHSFWKSKDKSEAREILNRTMDLAKSAKKNGALAKEMKREISQKSGELAKRVHSHRQKYFKTESIVKQLLEAEGILGTIEKLEETEKEFYDAEKRMESALMKASNFTVTINEDFKELETVLFSFRGASKAEAIVSSASKIKTNLTDCDARILQEAESKRKKKNRSNSLMGQVLSMMPDTTGTVSDADPDAKFSTWPDIDYNGLKTKFESSGQRCNHADDLLGPVELIRELSSLKSLGGQDMTWDIDIYMDKISMCTADALTTFSEMEFDEKKVEGNDKQAQLQEAQERCNKRLPGSSPALDEEGRLAYKAVCLCPDGAIEYFDKCTACLEIKKSFDNNISAGNHDQAKRILFHALRCEWVQQRQDKADLTDKEYCPQTNTVRLSSEQGSNQCVHCNELEKDFDAAVDGGDLEYAKILLGLASSCSWTADGQDKVNQARPCPRNTVKLSDDNGQNKCVSCDVLESDFNAVVDEGDLTYAETLLNLSQTCSWALAGQQELNQAKPCPADTVKLSDESNRNQCVPCSSLQADYNSALARGDREYATTLVSLASSCSWSRAAAQQMDMANQQAELDRKCWQQLPGGSHAVITGNRYKCYCDDDLLFFTGANGEKSCKTCEDIRGMINFAFQKNDLNGVRSLMGGAQNCSWYDAAVQAVANANANNRQQPPPSRQNTQQNNPLSGIWDGKITDLDPYKKQMYNIDGSKGTYYNMDFSGTFVLTITQNGNRLSGTGTGEGGSLPLSGSVNGNNVTLCFTGEDGRECEQLQVNYRSLTMSGTSYIKRGKKRGKPSSKWVLSKRR